MLNLDIFTSKMLRGGLVCVIDNSKNFLSSFIQTLQNDCSHIEDVHLYFVHISRLISSLKGVELRYFYVQNA